MKINLTDVILNNLINRVQLIHLRYCINMMAVLITCHQYIEGWVSWVQLSSRARCSFCACDIGLQGWLSCLLGVKHQLSYQPLHIHIALLNDQKLIDERQ